MNQARTDRAHKYIAPPKATIQNGLQRHQRRQIAGNLLCHRRPHGTKAVAEQADDDAEDEQQR